MTSDDFLSLIPTATADVDCGDERHRIQWSGGEITSLDHVDPDGERTLAALGATSNGCVDVLDAWKRREHELRVLTIASRGAADPLNPDRDGGGVGVATFGSRTAVRRAVGKRGRPSSVHGVFLSSAMAQGMSRVGPPVVDPADDYTTLFSLGGGLPDRLAATVAWHWSQRIEAGDTSPADQPALYAALAGRVWLAVRAWTGGTMECDVELIGPRDEPSATQQDGHWILAVPFRWLLHVWAPGLAVTAGRLVLDARFEAGTLVLTTLQPGTDRLTSMTLEL